MNLNYFKHTIHGDCYEINGDSCNVISITKDNLDLIAFDDSKLEGLYKELNVSKEEISSLECAVLCNDRANLVSILKKIHNRNKLVLEEDLLKIREITDPFF